MVNHISTSVSAPATDFSSWAGLLRREIKAHGLIITSCVIFFAIACLTNMVLGRPFGFSALPYLEMIFIIMVPISLMASLVIMFFYMALVKKPARLIPAILVFYKSLLLDPRRWAKAVPAIGFMMLGFMAFTDLKSAIPLLNPFSWDVAFMELDKVVHFGHHPWQLLQPVLGHTLPTLTINFVYNLWFFVMFAFWLTAGWTQTDKGWERQFLLSFIWCWMFGGILLATIFSSMGPAFYDLIAPASNPYDGQMQMLGAINENHTVLALGTQDVLRESYLNPQNGGVSGISAMPSLHNATSTLFMLAAYRMNKYAGRIMLAFLGFIIVGSVHLAWHYAVDAYAGIAIGFALWFVAGKALAWQDKGLKPTSTE